MERGTERGAGLLTNESSPVVVDGAAAELVEVDDGALLDGAVVDEHVLGGGEHGLHRVDAVGEQHPEALVVGGALDVGDYPHVHHLQHRLQRPVAAVGVLRDRRHRAGRQLRRHRAGEPG